MSDYTAYVRGQMEERKKSQTGRFMKDGFDRWAESSAPARVGQMEKEPAEATNTMRGEMTEREVGGVLPLLAAAPYVLPAAAGFATGVYAGVKGQRKVDAMRQQIAREERAKYGGMGMPQGAGFREGVRETQNLYGNLADAAVYGYDAYESAKRGVTGLPGALRSGAQVAESVLKVKDSAKKAADEFQKGGAKGSDGRARRAAIVKQVMSQRGVSMIEASRIVKSEGLY